MCGSALIQKPYKPMFIVLDVSMLNYNERHFCWNHESHASTKQHQQPCSPSINTTCIAGPMYVLVYYRRRYKSKRLLFFFKRHDRIKNLRSLLNDDCFLLLSHDTNWFLLGVISRIWTEVSYLTTKNFIN